MTIGKYEIRNLTLEEKNAAMAAIKLIRGSAIKNAYHEGFSDGFMECQTRRQGGTFTNDYWENSHAKLLEEKSSG